MPEAISYCDECARRIPGADIKSGEAIVTPDGAICAACLDALGPEKREALKKLAGAAAATSPPSSVMPAPRPKRPPTRRPTPGKAVPSGQRRRPDQAAREAAPRRKTLHTAREPHETRSKAGTMVMAGAAVGLIAGVLALVLFSSDASREGKRRRRAASAPSAIAPTRQADTAGSEGGRPGTAPHTPQRGGLARLAGPLPPDLDFSRPTRPAPVVPVTPPGRPGSSTRPGRVTGAAAGPLPPDISRGLVGHWTFDETEGTAAADSSGEGNGGSLHGNPEWLPGGGRIGGALAFFGYDGSDDYVEVANSPSLENVQEGDYTLTAWVCPDSLPQGTAEDRDPAYSIITKEGHRLGLEYSGDQTFAVMHSLSGDTCVRAASTDVYAPGAFHHVAGVVSKASGKVELYVDGRPAGSKTFTPGSPGKDYGVLPWRIGTADPGRATRPGECPATEGKIDDVRVYDRALAAVEVEMLYRDAEIAARIEAAGGLVAHWTFDEADGREALDASGNGFPGELVHMDAGVARVPGKIGRALEFDGVDDHVDCGNSPRFSDFTEFTLAVWVKPDDTSTYAAHGDPIIAKEGGFRGYQLTWHGDGRFGFMLADAHLTWSRPGKTNGTWYHVAGVFEKGTSHIYVNGVEEGRSPAALRRTQDRGTERVEGAAAAGKSPGYRANTGDPLCIGTYGEGGRYLRAVIDDVRIYNRALTAEEIGELYRASGARAATDSRRTPGSPGRHPAGETPTKKSGEKTARPGADAVPSDEAPGSAKQGLLGEYYDNMSLAGRPTLTRVDRAVNFSWGTRSPHPSLPKDSFGVRWTGTITPKYSETYTFYVYRNDGVRLWIDDELVIDTWSDGKEQHSARKALRAGVRYPIKIEYYEGVKTARIELSWQSGSQPREIVPASSLSPAAEWITIFNGRDMSGWRNEGGRARVEDGALVATDNADLFYKADWTEFELAAEIKAGDGRGGSVMGLGLAAERMGRGTSRVLARFFSDGDLHVSAQERQIWQAGAGKLPLGSWLPVRLVMTRDSLAVYRGETLLGTVDLSGVPLKKGGVYFYVNAGPTARLRNARVRPLHESGQPKSPDEAAKEEATRAAGSPREAGLLGEYYRNMTLMGDPAMTRLDPQIDFNWDRGSPDPKLPRDFFSVRWTGTITPEFSETYTFYIYRNDGIRFWIDGDLLISRWQDGRGEVTARRKLEAGRAHAIRLEYYEARGPAQIMLSWRSGIRPREVVPATSLSCEGKPSR